MARAPKQAPLPAPSTAPIPLLSAFDFLEGGFASAQRARRASIAIVMAALCVLTALLLAGVNSTLQKRSSEATLLTTTNENARATSELAQIDTAGGFTSDRLNAHIKERQTAAQEAVRDEIDVVAITRALQATAPRGVTITSIKFTQGGASTGVTNSAPIASTPATSGTTAPSASSGGGATLQVVGTVPGYSEITPWSQSVAKIPGLIGVKITWLQGTTSIPATITATVTDAGLTARSKTIGSTTKAGH